MTNQKKLARQWAQCVAGYDITATAGLGANVIAAAEFILANTEPETMADVLWNDEKHYMAGATVEPAGEECVMLSTWDGMIIVAGLQGGEDDVWLASTRSLVPNGKRYKLVEDTEPDHPDMLETREDYENAPEGTIVAFKSGAGVDLKCNENDWRYTGMTGRDSDIDMCGVSRRVLRWGWGCEA